MEVAMRAALASLLLTSLFISAGCTEVLTYANKSRDEGVRLYGEHYYADAAGAFRNAIRQDPRDFRSQYYLGLCYDELKQHHQSFASFRTSLNVMSELGPNYVDPNFRQQVLDAYGASVARHDENESEVNALIKRARAAPAARNGSSSPRPSACAAMPIALSMPTPAPPASPGRISTSAGNLAFICSIPLGKTRRPNTGCAWPTSSSRAMRP